MQKLCQPFLVIPVIFAFILSACGREAYYPEVQMTEQEAFDSINSTMQNGRNAFGKKLSTSELMDLIQKLIAEGKIKVPGQKRGAVDLNQVDLSALSQMLGLITSGQANNVFSLATQLLGLIPSIMSTATSGSSTLDVILSILQQAAPFIAAIAPQFAPIISGLLVIVPMVVSFIKMFKKPKATPTPSPSPAA